MPSSVPSIRLVVNSSYKGGTRQWSNRHHFTGGTPANSTAWTTLASNITTSWKAAMAASHTIVEAVGYAAGSDLPVFNEVLSIAGTYSLGANDEPCALANAALFRFATAARSSKNHPVYGFSYIHGAIYDRTVSGYDKLPTDWLTPLTTYANHWVSGFSDGTNTYVRSTAGGHTATGVVVEEYLTHRDFPYQSSV
jgi:hypothetical protein